MRRSIRTEKLIDKNGNFFGYKLFADFVSEHERGIEKLLTIFNIKGDGFQEEVKTNLNSKSLELIEVDNGVILLAEKNIFNEKSFGNEYLIDKLQGGSMWDSSNFAIFMENKEDLELLLEAEKNNDLLIGLFGDFSRLKDKGMYILINSRYKKQINE